MQGSLQQLPLPEVLQFISMGKSSGVLFLKREGNEITLTIRQGKIINSSAIDRRLRLGDLLVHRGILKRSELSHILKLQKKVESDKRLGQILVERDIVTDEDIRNTLRHQLEEEMWNLFAWPDGDFHFEAREPNTLGDNIVHIDIEPLILEGTRRNDEWAKIVEILPSDRLIPVIAEPDENFEASLKLKPLEWKVLSYVNGSFTIRAIMNRSNLGKFEVHMVLSQMVRAGLVILRTPEDLGIEISETNATPKPTKSNGNARQKSGGASKLISAFMTNRASKDKNEGRVATIEFHSPVGLLAYLNDELVQRVHEAREYTAQSGDDRYLESIWFDLLPVFSRADALVVQHNHVDPRVLETYLQNCNYAPYVDNCFEDGVEGLLTLLQTSAQGLAIRIGEKPLFRIGGELMDEVVSRAKIAHRPDYESLNERINNALRGTGS